MSKTKAIIGVCLIFFMGIVTGVALTMKLVEKRIHSLTEGGAQALGEIVVRRLDSQLKLNAQQRGALQEIVESTGAQMRAVRKKEQPEIERIMEASARKIRAILTPEEAEKFDAMLLKGRERWKAFGE